MVAALTRHHREQPLAPGLEMEAMRVRLPYEVRGAMFRALIDRFSSRAEDGAR